MSMTPEEEAQMKEGKQVGTDVSKLWPMLAHDLLRQNVPMKHWPWVLTMLASQEAGVHTPEWQEIRQGIVARGPFFTARLLGYLGAGMRHKQQEKDAEAAMNHVMGRD